MDWWVAHFYQLSPAFLASWVVIVIGSIVLHELGHGYAATALGDDTPRLSGHLTLNPVVHIPLMSWILFAAFGFAWGMMPVNTARLRGRYADALVAIAGPGVNLALAAISLLALILWHGFGEGIWVSGFEIQDPLFTNTSRFFQLGVMLNAVLFVLNLVPVPPLDGWRIASSVVPPYGRLWASERGAQFGLIAFVLLFFFGARYVVSFGAMIAMLAIGLVMGLVVPQANLPSLFP